MEWIIAVVDGILMICILGGNCLTVTVIVRKPKLATPSNQFVLGLALADMLVGISMPYHMAFYISDEINHWLVPCLIRFVLMIMACSASVLHLICVAVDRYLAIIYPLRHQVIVTKGRARQAIFCNWVIAVAISTMPIYWNDWTVHSQYCSIENILPANFFLCVVIPAFTILLVIMLGTYVRIHQVASSHATRLSQQRLSCSHISIHVGTNDIQHLQKGKKSMQVVALVLGCFCVCWCPYLTIGTIILHGYKTHTLDLAYNLAFSFAMANSCMNPVIYAWKNQDFKCAFQELLGCCRTKPSLSTEEIVRSRSQSNIEARASASTSRSSINEIQIERF
ncbi:octopamine receptor 1-like [Neocloeon triangulifer]|uniref:octopamine receptor 1-like n=1 Tax=Neocloeon triangulifer TaxID=2078957 RepID=UPI00286F40BC|nr:octopamine receptor 1-like [Neocloeon triangulifer]